MTVTQSKQSPASDSAANAAYRDLVAKKRVLAFKSASLQTQIKAIDDAITALRTAARDNMIRLEVTDGEAGLLMTIASSHAERVLATNRQLAERLHGLTDRIFQAMYEQDADYARRVQAYYATAAADAGHNQGQEAGSKKRRPPKKDCPYLRYTVDQMQQACDDSELGSGNGYTRRDYARLYLSRDALVEMYKRPRCVKLVYTYILKPIDEHDGDSCGPVFPERDYQPIRPSAVSGSRPYERHTEAEMRRGLKELCLTPRKVATAYGCFAVSLIRDAVLRLYRSGPGHPGVACLVRMFDERRLPGSRTIRVAAKE